MSKLMKDITTGALRRKRGVADDFDISDDEDAFSRRREAKRREFARMRRELLRDEAVGKIADDGRKSAFFQSIEDRDDVDEEAPRVLDEELDSQLQSQSQLVDTVAARPPLQQVTGTALNIARQSTVDASSDKPVPKPMSLAQIQQQVSFLIEDPESQPVIAASSPVSATHIAYLDMDRHLAQANADESALDSEDEGLGGFIVNDSEDAGTQTRIPDSFPTENPRRTAQPRLSDRLNFFRSSSSSLSLMAEQPSVPAVAKITAFMASAAPSTVVREFKIPGLVRQGTTDSARSEAGVGISLLREESGLSTTGSELGTGTERGTVDADGNLIRKGGGGRRNAVNFAAKGSASGRVSERLSRVEAGFGEKMAKVLKGGEKERGGFLGGLFGGGSWK